MAERIVSAGVFTNEVDQSFLPKAIGQIGAAIVGPTVKGPALVPTKISSFSEFQQIFGSYTPDSYVPFTVEEYLRNGNVMTVTRLLYEDGYALKSGGLAIIAKSGSVQVVTHVLHPTQPVTYVNASTNVFENSILTNLGSGSFTINVSGSYSTDLTVPGFTAFLAPLGTAISSSINSTANSYLTKIFGASPKSVDYPVYVQYENKTATSLFNNLGNVTVELANLSNYEFLADYSTATTPYITSQKIGTTVKNLFRFSTLSHGTSVSSELKIGIRDVRLGSEVADPNGYGTFTVEVRRVNTTNIANTPYSSQDTDQVPDIVETYMNCNLDPDSPNYIVQKIGNRYQTVSDSGIITVNGEYPNISRYIRVDVTDAVANKANEKTLVPFGFRAMSSPMPMASGSLNLSAVTYSTSQVVSNVFNANNYLGFDFTATNNLNYLAPVPTSGSTTGSNADFYLGNVSQDADAAFPSLTAPYSGSVETALTTGTSFFTANVATSTRKFMVPMQGGFDGARPNLPKMSGAYIKSTNTFGFDCSTATSTGTKSYNKAFTLLSNTDYYDFNMLVTPGILDSKHGNVTSLARNLVTNRQDAFYVMDSNAITDSTATTVNQVLTLDNNYTATYWPWVRITRQSKPLWVPPSVVVPGALAFNDAVSFPWYAPAGLNRGGLTTVSDTYINLSQADRNTLYEARVNPIANFPNDGVVIWGQKTLQARPSALDRVNVRRLLIAVKKFIASSTRYLVFDQNTSATRDKFTQIVNPYLESVRAQQGLYAFRVVMDATNNTPDVIDQNILYGQIFLQPTRTAEFIILDFNIQPTGAAFPE